MRNILNGVLQGMAAALVGIWMGLPWWGGFVLLAFFWAGRVWEAVSTGWLAHDREEG